MAMRSRTTFKKRQKELARQEKQRDKAARRVQRKLERTLRMPEMAVLKMALSRMATLVMAAKMAATPWKPVGPSTVSSDAPIRTAGS